MGNIQPKQYLPLAGWPLIAYALQTLCAVNRIEKVFVVLAPTDREWQRHDWSRFGDKLVPLYCGGETRAQSVRNGLAAMADRVHAADWVLVHDAARPCLTVAQVEALMREVGDDSVGGILALPLADTLKRADTDGRIETTIARDNLWLAQTPQMFRHGMLLKSLAAAPEATDEASAMEHMGFHPRLVRADASNFKVTYADDLQLAEWVLRQRENK